MKERFDLTKANITIEGKFMSGYCSDCGNTGCECDEITRATYPLRYKITELEKKLAEALDKKLQWSDACYQAQDKLKVAVEALGKIGDSDVVWIDSAKRIASETLLKIRE